MSEPNTIKPEDCPEPFWHKTHRYCPVCSYVEETPVQEERVDGDTADLRVAPTCAYIVRLGLIALGWQWVHPVEDPHTDQNVLREAITERIRAFEKKGL